MTPYIQKFKRRDGKRFDARLKLEEGGPADFVLFDPDHQWEVTEDRLNSKSKNSSFLGEKLYGQVVATFMGGRLTWHDPEASV